MELGFLHQIPIVIIGIIGTYKFIQNSKAATVRKINLPGAILSIAGFFALVYGIIQAGTDRLDCRPVSYYAFVAAFVLLTAFIFWELKSPNAMLPINFFKNMSFTGANISLTLVTFGMLAHFSSWGNIYKPCKIIRRCKRACACCPWPWYLLFQRRYRRASPTGSVPKITVSLGILIAAIGFFYLASIAAVNTDYGQLALAMCITALGIGLVMSPGTNSVMGSIPVNQAGVGSAMSNTTRQIGGALGVAVLGTLLNSTYLARINEVKWPAQLPPAALEAIHNSVQGAHGAAQAISQSSPQLAQLIITNADAAFVAGSRHALLISAIIIIVAAGVTAIILPNRVRPRRRRPIQPIFLLKKMGKRKVQKSKIRSQKTIFGVMSGNVDLTQYVV